MKIVTAKCVVPRPNAGEGNNYSSSLWETSSLDGHDGPDTSEATPGQGTNTSEDPVETPTADEETTAVPGTEGIDTDIVLNVDNESEDYKNSFPTTPKQHSAFEGKNKNYLKEFI